MSKLPKANKFIDLSDYGRPVARLIAQSLKPTSFTAVHVTLLFVVSGICAIYCILHQHFIAAGLFLILKSILDAADGELARLKNQPSYVGRYLDSVCDILLNFAFLLTIWYITDSSIWLMLLAFIGVELQGTLYNYYYVILRNRHNGDTTSRVFEHETPTALPGEKQRDVNILFTMYKVLYGAFDQVIYVLDSTAVKSGVFTNSFMTALTIFGLGFQLLIMAIFLAFNLSEWIIPTFNFMTIGIVVFIGIRKVFMVKK
jgi:CDP-diacylglycerol--serine O-phosphatidyltransferase